MHPEPPAVVAPSHEDTVVRGLSQAIGGPLGRHARVTNRWWTPVRVLILLALLSSFLGWAQKAPCRDPGRWQHEYQYTRVCYSDVEALYFSEELVGDRDPATGQGSRLKVPYFDHAVEYPVVIGGLMWVAAEATNLIHPDDPHVAKSGGTVIVDNRPTTFFDVTALLLTIAALGLVIATYIASGKRRPWDAAMVAVAPAIVFHAFTNWDLAAAALATGAIAAWARRRPWLAGVLLGLGTATKLYPALFLLPLFFLCLRSKQLQTWAKAVIAGIVAWAAVDLPIWMLEPDGFGRFFSLNRTRVADFDTWWYAIQQRWPGFLDDPSTLNVVVAVVIGLAMAALVLLIMLAPRRPRLGQVLFLAVALFLLFNKVYSPQYVIWLLPLAVLARPRWGAFLFWQATEAALLVVRFMYFIGLDAARAGRSAEGASFGWFETAVLLRDGALILLIVLVVREILRPSLDVVRRYGDDDPAGGVLDGAPDRSGAWVPHWTYAPESARA